MIGENKSFPLVSIVTPSFNQAKYLRETIESILNQTYPNIEYIIIDGGSNDGSFEIIGDYKNKLAYWVSEPDKGQTDAINKGFAKSNGAILAWLNADDVYEPHAVEEAVGYLSNFPEYDLVYGDANYINKNSKVIGKFPASQTDYKRLQQGYVHIPQQSAFFRASAWKRIGPLDPTYFFAMDYDLWVRIARKGVLQYVPRTWANFRLHDDAKSFYADDQCWSEMLRVHYRDGGKFLSIIQLKYWIRKLVAPVILWRRKKMFGRVG